MTGPARATMRLQKLLAQAGVASRRQAEALIAAGAVTVNGQPVTAPGVEVDPARDRVEVHGRRVMGEPPSYRLLLKPRECLSTIGRAAQPGQAARPTLKRYLRDAALPWKVVGPLDFPSEGVLLLTTDGELAERLSRAQSRLPMTYHVKFQGSIGDEDIARLQRGWRHEDRPVRPTAVIPIATTGKNTWLEIVVADMRPRALRSAGLLLRKHVLKISRTRFGALSFEGLRMGGHRELTAREVSALRQAAGLAAPEPVAAGRGVVKARP